MTDKYFEENNKFLGFKGILNRRNFIVNFFIIEVIESLILTTPLIYLLYTNTDLMLDFTSSALKANTFPLWWTIWVGIVGLIECGLLYPSIVRRVRDIIGEVDENRIMLISSVLGVLLLVGYSPAITLSPIFRWISIFIILVLMCIKGKITKDKPKNEVAKFNWGACFGTWLWGLFNKTPITLCMLPLLLTTGWFPFMIICGLKGNEWAYKNNKKYDNLEDFHKSQSNQSALWLVLTPIFVIISFIVMFVVSGIMMYNYTKTHPEFLKKIEAKTNEYQEVAVKTNFDKIELTENEYKFYMDPKIWVKLPESSKKSSFDVASNYVMSKKYPNAKTDKVKLEDRLSTRNKIKIYSTFNNEVLAEYYLSTEEVNNTTTRMANGEKGMFKKYMELYSSGFKINNHPTLP